ncbi:RNA polymerase sigma factor [Maribellus mangrovi]|uniref:RNA polymerase sigma factor n=1 Tax=Maribellus mangrovi TaxID=3133146 RepID=UPI0030EE0C1F
MTTEEFNNTVIPFSRKLYPMLFRILKNEEETRDALQDLMVKLWDKRNDLVQCTNQTAYIITMAKNHSFDLLKKKRPQRISEKEEHKLHSLSTDSGMEIKEQFEHVRMAIEALPEKYREVIRLRDIDGFEFDEISEMTGYEVPYIRVILSRARQKVKDEVNKKYEYDQSGKIARQVL